MFNTAYGERNRVGKSFLMENSEGEMVQAIGRTEQNHKKSCDINFILKQHDRTGLITHVNNTKAYYGDFTEVNEYQDALNIVIHAQESFAELPSDVRKRFGNDPGEFIEFVTNDNNIDEMVAMGLAVLPTPEEPTKVQIVTDGTLPDGDNV